jgi:hypothetical protein
LLLRTGRESPRQYEQRARRSGGTQIGFGHGLPFFEAVNVIKALCGPPIVSPTRQTPVRGGTKAARSQSFEEKNDANNHLCTERDDVGGVALLRQPPTTDG